MRAALPLFCLMASGFVAELALACSVNSPAGFEIRGDAADHTPPAPPKASVARIKRGKGPKQQGCSQTVSSCDSTAYVLLDVSVPGESEIGFVLDVKGHYPASLAAGAGQPITPHSYEPGQLRLYWEDGEGERNYDFEIEVWSVDRAGNMSETSTRLRIDDDGSDGCSTHAGGSNAGWLAALCALLFVRRPRRRTLSM